MTALAIAVRRRLRPTPPLPRRTVAVSAVCAGHVLVLLALLSDRQATPRDKAAAPRLLQIRLLPAPRVQAAAAPAVPATPTTPRASMPAQVVAGLRPPDVPAAAVSEHAPVPAPPAPAASAGDAGAPAADPGGATATAAGRDAAELSLKPSREVLLGSLGSNAAVNDPRSNTPRPTFEERIAMALNPELCVKVERLPDGTIRRSMGKWRSVLSTAQSSGVTSGGGSGAGVAPPGGGGLTFGGGGGGIRLCT